MSLLKRVKPEYNAIFEHGILTDETTFGKIPHETILKMAVVCPLPFQEVYKAFNPGLVGENYATLSVDYSDYETKQEIKVDQCTIEIGHKIYDVSISGVAVLKPASLDDNELEVAHIEDLDYNIYNSKNEDMNDFNLDITPDQIEDILKELCC